MGLDLFPRRKTDPDTTKTTRTTHHGDDVCPFSANGFPLASTGNCCSLRGKVAAENLHALGEYGALALLHEDGDADHALRVADRLRDTANHLEQKYAGLSQKPSGGYYGGRINGDTGEFTPWPQPSFEEAIASIRQAADWYEKVARLGFGVHAWY
jgi:hypothetical protein